jgi:hypothetical protein
MGVRAVISGWVLIVISHSFDHSAFSPLSHLLAMESKSRRQKGYHDARSSLNAAIDALNLARGEVATKPAKDLLYSASILLTTIRVSFLPVHVDRLLTDVRRTR